MGAPYRARELNRLLPTRRRLAVSVEIWSVRAPLDTPGAWELHIEHWSSLDHFRLHAAVPPYPPRPERESGSSHSEEVRPCAHPVQPLLARACCRLPFASASSLPQRLHARPACRCPGEHPTPLLPMTADRLRCSRRSLTDSAAAPDDH